MARNVLVGAACSGLIGAVVMEMWGDAISVVPVALCAVIGAIVSLAYMRGEPR